MVEQRVEQSIDAIVYNWIKLGYNSPEEIVKLKHDFQYDIKDVVATLKRLKSYELVKLTKDRVLLNGLYDV